MSDEADGTVDTTVVTSADSSDQTTVDLTRTSQTGEETPQDSSAAVDPTSDANASPQGVASADTATPPDTSTGQDPGQPYLFVDLFSGDDGRLVGKHPDWQVLANTKSYFGAILKAWDGTRFNDGGWFQRHWPAVRAAGGDRYGDNWFRGAYLFLEFSQSGAGQADAYLQAVDSAGGWDRGDILPIIDAEQGGEGRPALEGKPAVPAHPNRSATKQKVIDCVTACANRIRERTGRRIMLYGRGAMRDLGINDRMGCDLVWNPAYTPTMVRHGLEAWNLEDIVLWQYCGDGTAAVANLPRSVPGFGTCDLSVFVKGARPPTLQLLRDNLLT
jgi:GH25 family lysozyme M1 (1,4-beta-N-acetylmuramidase)